MEVLEMDELGGSDLGASIWILVEDAWCHELRLRDLRWCICLRYGLTEWCWCGRKVKYNL